MSEASELPIVDYRIHHQAFLDCPECGEEHIEDLGEDDSAEGIEIKCEYCGHEFELGSEL